MRIDPRVEGSLPRSIRSRMRLRTASRRGCREVSATNSVSGVGTSTMRKSVAGVVVVRWADLDVVVAIGGGARDPGRATRGRLDQGPGDHGARVPAAPPYGRHRRGRMAVLCVARLRRPRAVQRRGDHIGTAGAGATVRPSATSPSTTVAKE